MIRKRSQKKIRKHKEREAKYENKTKKKSTENDFQTTCNDLDQKGGEERRRKDVGR